MKRFKKFAAVVLACVMALTLLTACGGGGGSSSNGSTETQLTAAINENLKSSNIHVTYSEGLGDQYANVMNTMQSVYQKTGDINQAMKEAQIAAEAAGFGNGNGDVISATYTSNTSIRSLADTLANQIKDNHYGKSEMKIGYASGVLGSDSSLYVVFAILKW